MAALDSTVGWDAGMRVASPTGRSASIPYLDPQACPSPLPWILRRRVDRLEGDGGRVEDLRGNCRHGPQAFQRCRAGGGRGKERRAGTVIEPCRLSAYAAARGIAEGTLSSERLVRSCIERILEREETVRAWEHFAPDHALEQARRCDRSASKGLLHGLPVGVKDVLDTVDMPTLWGDVATFGDRRPHRNAPVVQRLHEENAVLLGKTTVSRFGFWWPGKARNPHNPEHTPGSSSSGSAAAVADCMCPLSVGTQTEGSIMRPSAFCGVVGLVPTHGWLAWRNSRDYAPTLDVVGGFGRSVQDMLFLMRGLTGRTAFESRGCPRRDAHDWPVPHDGLAEGATLHAGHVRADRRRARGGGL